VPNLIAISLRVAFPQICEILRFCDFFVVLSCPVQSCPGYRQACAYRSHAGIVFAHGFFAPQGRHVAPIRSAPRANFHVYRGKNVGIQLLKVSKFRISARNLYLRGDSFAIFLRNSQHLYASTGSF